MPEENKIREKYLRLFNENMKEVDKLQQVVLVGHLIIERALDSIISTIFFHPSHILQARLSFDQKLRLVRSYSIRKDSETIWNLVSSINILRNDMAHNLAEKRQDKKFENVRNLYFAELSLDLKAAQKDAPNEVIATYACALCTGYLGAAETDINALRNHINALDTMLNPDKPRIL